VFICGPPGFLVLGVLTYEGYSDIIAPARATSSPFRL